MHSVCHVSRFDAKTGRAHQRKDRLDYIYVAVINNATSCDLREVPQKPTTVSILLSVARWLNPKGRANSRMECKLTSRRRLFLIRLMTGTHKRARYCVGLRVSQSLDAKTDRAHRTKNGVGHIYIVVENLSPFFTLKKF